MTVEKMEEARDYVLYAFGSADTTVGRVRLYKSTGDIELASFSETTERPDERYYLAQVCPGSSRTTTGAPIPIPTGGRRNGDFARPYTRTVCPILNDFSPKGDFIPSGAVAFTGGAHYFRRTLRRPPRAPRVR